MEQLATALPVIQIILSIVLATLILFQQSEGALGSAFGGGMGGVAYEKRGLEKYLFYATIGGGILFTAAALLSLVLPS